MFELNGDHFTLEDLRKSANEQGAIVGEFCYKTFADKSSILPCLTESII